MPFDPTPISNPTIVRDGDMLAIKWDSSAPAGSVYQVYIDRGLAWHGTVKNCLVSWPIGPIWLDIGVVPPGDSPTDFGPTLSGGFEERAELTWYGGTYLSTSIDSFSIYGSPRPGQPVSYTRPLGTVPAYEGSIVADGAGIGPCGFGGAGQSASIYSWTSAVLEPGTWTFAVQPVDAAGNHSTGPAMVSVTIVGPPNPPAIDPATGRRLAYTYDPSTHRATLRWLASPP